VHRLSSIIANMLLPEDISDDLRLPLPATHVRSNTSDHFGAVAGAAVPQAIGPDVLVEQLIRIELRAIPRAGGSGAVAPRRC